MTQEIPSLEEMVPAEQQDKLKSDLSSLAVESYQPVLDTLIDQLGYKGIQANIGADVMLFLVTEADGKPVLQNSVTMEVLFQPEHALDGIEEEKRKVVREQFSNLVRKAL